MASSGACTARLYGRERSRGQASLFPGRARRLARSASAGAYHHPMCEALSHECLSSLMARYSELLCDSIERYICCAGTSTSCCSLLDSAVNEAIVLRALSQIALTPASSSSNLEGSRLQQLPHYNHLQTHLSLCNRPCSLCGRKDLMAMAHRPC